MTPKEKAKELVHKFTIDLEPFSEYGKWDKMQGKECALIAVDEILKVGTFHRLTAENQYWEEVKQEIKNL